MKKRKKSILVIFVIILVTLLATAGLASMKKAPDKKANTGVTQRISTLTVNNGPVRVNLDVYGRTSAVKMMSIYSEVSGVLENASYGFQEGSVYKKGDLMLDINSEEASASLTSLKSSFLTQLSSYIVELKYEYPESYPVWADYVKNFEIEAPIRDLPEPASEKEKVFLSSQSIYNSYYSIVSQEIRLKKYQIYAPYDGILTESYVKPGMLVMSGQKLGSFVNEEAFDLKIAVKLSDLDFIHIGDDVELTSTLTAREYSGYVQRINGSINQSTQTVNVYVRVSGEGLKENMFLEGNLVSGSEFYGQEIPRKCLIDNQDVYVVSDDNSIKRQSVTVYQIHDDKAVIGGLADGTLISDRTSGIYEGLKVLTGNQKEKQQSDMPAAKTDASSEKPAPENSKKV